MDNYKVQTNKADIISIKGENEKEVMRVEKNGDVFWIKDGELQKANVESDLAEAFFVVVSAMGFDVDEYKAGKEHERERVLEAVAGLRKEYTVEPPFSSNSEDYRKQSYNKALDDIKETIEQ